jgi:holo-[acyl-carrier protein] synthase
MIIGIGCDIVEHSVTEQLKWHLDLKTRQRFFSLQEIDLHRNRINASVKFLSGRFAAKEAVLKCIGTGMEDGISLTDIEILSDKRGKPTIILKGDIKNISEEIGINLWHVSITHSSSCSMAFVIAESSRLGNA